jgi:hypothetical protein
MLFVILAFDELVLLSSRGEGVPDLLLLLVRWVPEIMIEKLVYDNSVEVCALNTIIPSLLKLSVKL